MIPLVRACLSNCHRQPRIATNTCARIKFIQPRREVHQPEDRLILRIPWFRHRKRDATRPKIECRWKRNKDDLQQRHTRSRQTDRYRNDPRTASPARRVVSTGTGVQQIRGVSVADRVILVYADRTVGDLGRSGNASGSNCFQRDLRASSFTAGKTRAASLGPGLFVNEDNVRHGSRGTR